MKILVWNGRKLMEKSSSIPFHTMPWQQQYTVKNEYLFHKISLDFNFKICYSYKLVLDKPTGLHNIE